MSQQDMSWRQADARRQIIGKIFSSVKQSGIQSLKNCADIENQIFRKAKTKEEYYKYTAGAIMVLRNKVNIPSTTGVPLPSNMQMPVSQNNGMVRMPVTPQIQIRSNLSANQQMKQVNVRNMGTIRHQAPVQLKPNLFTQIIRPNIAQTSGMNNNLQPRMKIPQNRQPVIIRSNNFRPAGVVQNRARIPFQNPPQNAIIRQQIPQSKVPIVVKSTTIQQNQYKPVFQPQPNNGIIRNSFNNTLNINNLLSKNVIVLNKANPSNILMPKQNLVKTNVETKSVDTKPRYQVVSHKPIEQTELKVISKVPTLTKQPTPIPIIIDDTPPSPEPVLEKEVVRDTVQIPPEMLAKYNLIEDILPSEEPYRSSSNVFQEEINFQSFLDLVRCQLNNPNINKTLKRTFQPVISEFLDVNLNVPLPMKRKCIEQFEETNDSNVVYGEVCQINIEKRFYVFIQSGNDLDRSLTLHCDIRDKRLPDIPPIVIHIPENYPTTSPSCKMSADAYSGTDFLSDIREGFEDRITKLPPCFTLSHLLENWELSVRQAWGGILKGPDALVMKFGL